jgi:hypothetical protein
MGTVPTLILVREAKICDLLMCDQPNTRWEASGVLVKDGHYFVVFDDRTEIGRFSDDLHLLCSAEPGLAAWALRNLNEAFLFEHALVDARNE